MITIPQLTAQALGRYNTPCEGTSYEIGSMSIIKGARDLKQAQCFYDWALTPEAQKLGFDAGKQLQMPSNKAMPLPPGANSVPHIRQFAEDSRSEISSAPRCFRLRAAYFHPLSRAQLADQGFGNIAATSHFLKFIRPCGLRASKTARSRNEGEFPYICSFRCTLIPSYLQRTAWSGRFERWPAKKRLRKRYPSRLEHRAEEACFT